MLHLESITEPARRRVRRRAAPARGQRVGLVPTMGSLHEGHRSLIARGPARPPTFVGRDDLREPAPVRRQTRTLDAYPRDLGGDLAASAKRNASTSVFAPERPERCIRMARRFHDRARRPAHARTSAGAARPHALSTAWTTVVAKLFRDDRPVQCVLRSEGRAGSFAVITAHGPTTSTSRSRSSAARSCANPDGTRDVESQRVPHARPRNASRRSSLNPPRARRRRRRDPQR